ncbi:MAG: hypothetical protein IJ720_00615 [Clostridia bacterium]|nr:hypothetical protein [Clostridia bacterium]MBR1703847.1 hypothetical protein [Clostridia bacterium]
MPDSKENLFEQYGFSSSKSKTEAPDFGGFLAGTPVREEAEPEPDDAPVIGEEYIAPADAPVEETDPDLNYMANMQNMFKSLSLDTTEEEEERVEAPAPEDVPDPEPELSSFLFGTGNEPPVKTSTNLLTSEETPATAPGRFTLKNPRKKKKGLQLNPELMEQSKR